jgi:hypothetical protein
MLRTYHSTKELFYCILRTPKDDSYFVYFTLESNEGICFYYTAEDSLNAQYRDTVVRCPIEWTDDLKALIKRLQAEIRLDILEEKIILDS